MTDPFAESKRTVARAAAELVQSGMRVGLGTGSTFTHAIDRLAERMKSEGLEFVGVPTSIATERKAREFGILLTTLDEVDGLDLAIDGADEVDRNRNLIKGGGGALLREKIVAAASHELVVVVTENKVVDRLGATFALPVEIVPFGARQVRANLVELDLVPTLRNGASGEPFVTDNGNWIFDCELPSDSDCEELERRINCIPGVVENGFFIGMAGRVLIGCEGGEVRPLA
ncbi:MAG: ribose-5-phosphate isomerase RpiA [Planctomycetes bacterium]|nr:ribose-5-phosphate isomerase RpiA [Planctomycetota bacterium]